MSYETLDRNGHKVKATGEVLNCYYYYGGANLSFMNSNLPPPLFLYPVGSVSHSSSFLNSPSLPYILLGLGTTPNFIESLTIGLANNESDSSWYRSWPLLVPNSQLILIPSPISKPPKYENETMQITLLDPNFVNSYKFSS